MENCSFSNPVNAHAFVDWFRQASPYIHAHCNRTFVICFDGEAVNSNQFTHLIHDIALLSSLGIRLVLVHGNRPQIEHCLKTKGIPSRYVRGIRVTEEAALHCAKAACGEVRATIESYLSMGLTNSPSTDFRIRTASGNFVVARPVGIRHGVDYCYTGAVRRIDVAAITRQLDERCIVMLSPLGYSPTGEVFNLLTEDVAAEVAIALQAAKWICLTEAQAVTDAEGQMIRQLTMLEAQQWLAHYPEANSHRQVMNAVRACQQGVQRVHLVNRHIEGALLLELFTRDGIGTLISTDPFEHIRKATIEDIGGLLKLLEPLEESGILVRRSREKLEVEIQYFTVQERDGMIVACAALYPFVDERMAELACLAVHDNYRGTGRGDALLAFLEREALRLDIQRIFVLTTQTAHWFRERNFLPADLDALPVSRRTLYNYQRNSKVFMKQLEY